MCNTVDIMYSATGTILTLITRKHLHGSKLLGGVVDGAEFDYFHDLVVVQELARGGMREFADGNLSGLTISVPIMLLYAPPEWRDRVVSQ